MDDEKLWIFANPLKLENVENLPATLFDPARKTSF